MRTRLRLTFSRRQRGQALTEIAIASALVFVPMLLLIFYIGKLANVKYTSQQASRYAAWERTVWRENRNGVPGAVMLGVKDRNTVDREMVERMYQDTRVRGLRTTITQTPRSARGDHMWRETDGTRLVELDRTNGNAQQGTRPRLATYQQMGTGSSTVGTVLNAISAVSGGPRINTRGFAQAQADVRTNAYLPGIFRNNEYGPVLFSSRDVVLTDQWSAGGAVHEEWIVEPLVLGNFLDNAVVDTIVNIGFALVGMDAPEFGKVDPDRLPTDRRR